MLNEEGYACGTDAAAEQDETCMLSRTEARRWDFDDTDFFTQPGDLWRVMSPDQQRRLADNLGAELGKCSAEIRERMVGLLEKCSPDYAQAVGAVAAPARPIAFSETATGGFCHDVRMPVQLVSIE
eukprot:gene55195-60121_t